MDKQMIGIIIQARTGSKRFKKKIYEDINGKTTLYRVLEGCMESDVPHKIILAMPKYDQEEFERRFCNGDFDGAVDERFGTYFGHPDNLVDRYFKAARKYNIDLVIRVTADCPLIRGVVCDEMLIEYMKNGYNGYMGNNKLISTNPYPGGLDLEIFPYWILAETHQLATTSYDKEHATPYMYRRGTQYNIYEFKNQKPNVVINNRFSDLSFDTKEDLVLIKKVAKIYDECLDINKAINNI